MGEGESFSAEAKGYANAARKREEKGQFEDAKKLYLKSASSFLKASKASILKKDKDLRRELAETFYGKAMSFQTSAQKTKYQKGSGKEGEIEKEIVPIEKPKINFSHVGGLKSVKEEISKAIIYPFKHPEIYEHYKKKIGEGILLYGPPGCGKTFIAKASAGECGASFLTLKISEILGKWLGESEKNISAAFESASKYQPAILFFDEIDAIGGRRDEGKDSNVKRVVNALLVELDGVTSSSDKRLTLAATNTPWAVDPALRRPGRFSKLLYVPPPDYDGRVEIFKLNMKERPVAKDIDFNELSKRTDGFSCADISQICEEAADIPLMEALEGKNPRKIEMSDFIDVFGKRKSSLTSWFRLAKDQINKSGEEDLFSELLATVDKYSN